MSFETSTASWATNNLVVLSLFRATGRTTLYNLSTHSSFDVASPTVAELLVFCASPRTREELLTYVCERERVSVQTAERLVQFCIEKSILQPAAQLRDDAHGVAFARWRRFGWEASGIYHFFSWNFPFLDYSRPEAYHTDQSLMTAYKGNRPEPSRFKEYPETPFIALSKDLDSLNETSLHALQDSAIQAAALNATTIERLGTLLYYSFGQIGSIHFPVVEPLLRKTSPSGGARHPTEAYLALFDIDGIEPGLYHYSVKRHGLEQVAQGNFKYIVMSSLSTIGERTELEPTAVLFFTSLVERNMWRYREPRTYRVVHLDLGHISWTAYLVALGLGIPTFAHHGMRDEIIEKLFGLNAVDESAYWYMALG